MDKPDNNNYTLLYVGASKKQISKLQDSESINVIHAANAVKAYNELKENDSIDAVICERIIKGSSGISFYSYLKHTGVHHNTPFIIVTKEFEPRVRDIVIKEGIDDLYKMPISIEYLKIRLKFLIRYKRHYAKKFGELLIPESNVKYSIPLEKRVFDVLISSLALLFLSPLFLVVSMLIWIESGFKGNVYYASQRVGTGYQIFDFYKFRSMKLNADKMLKELAKINNQYGVQVIDDECAECKRLGRNCSPILKFDDKEICENLYNKQQKAKKESSFVKIKDDPRVTKVGKFIRNTSMDELPQLINVLKGDMSIVGNRPLPLYEAALLTTDQWGMRFQGPSGITGLWQVELRGKKGGLSLDERKSLDNDYAKNYSFWGDMKLILRTIPALFQEENV